MKEAIKRDIEYRERVKHSEELYARYKRIKNLPFERLKQSLFDILFLEKVCNFFGRTLK